MLLAYVLYAVRCDAAAARQGALSYDAFKDYRLALRDWHEKKLNELYN